MILAIDIGGSQIRIGLFDEKININNPCWVEIIPSFYSYNDLLSYICLINDRVKHYNLIGVGVSIGISFSKDGRRVIASGKLNDFEKKDIASDFENIFKCKCIFAHDCICALIAEQSVRDLNDHMAYVTVSSGIGGAVFLKNDINAIYLRTRLAHQILQYDGEACKCGQKGCLATFVDSIEIEKKIKSKLENIDDENFWLKYVDYLAVGLVNLSWLYPIKTIVVGGGVTLNSHFVIENLKKKFSKLRKSNNQYDCIIEKPFFGELSPIIGAARIVIDKNINILYT
jgi:glucokinase